MIDRIIGWSVRNRIFVVLSTVVMAGWGAYAAWIAPIDAIPDLSENQVIVYAEWAGRGPGEIEDQITAPLSLELTGVRGVKVIRSSSDFGASTLWVIFDDMVDVPTARRSLSERLTAFDSQGSLPSGVTPRLAPEGPATGQIFWYTVEGPQYDLGRLRAIQDWYVKPKLAAIPGVAEVASVGGMAPEFQVEADPTRLRLHKVALNDLIAAISASNGSSGAGVLHKGNAEFVVRGVNWMGDRAGVFNPDAAIADLRRVVVPTIEDKTVMVADVASVALGPQPRRGALEKDGIEVVGGVILMANGENPLALTRRLKAKIRDIAGGLPVGVKIVPMYDRTPLILGAVETISTTILEAMLTASLCVLLILKHARAALVISLTLPLSVLASFGVLEWLRRFGIMDVPINAMSLAGLAISIGVIVDSAIVMTENAINNLHMRFCNDIVTGDVSDLVVSACRQVGRPIIFSILIMLLSFIPVFALGGLEGKMFRPLAMTKTLAMAASGTLAVTLIPALCSILVRGRARLETDSRIVRSLIDIYRPVLSFLIDRPAALLWLLAATFLTASAAVGSKWLFLGSMTGGLLAVGIASRGSRAKIIGMATLVVFGLVVDTNVVPLGREFLTPLDEGIVMDMPISVPRMSIVQGIDDLKARDMVLCRFPEVAMVTGKLGRAETPTDPAPLDMIETMVEFHPREFWPARSLEPGLAARQVKAVIAETVRRGLIERPDRAVEDAVAESCRSLFDAQMREYAYQRNRELFRSPGFKEVPWRMDGLSEDALRRWRSHAQSLDVELRERGAGLFARRAIEETLAQAKPRKPSLTAYIDELKRLRSLPAIGTHHATARLDHAMSRTASLPVSLAPQPEIDVLQEKTTAEFAGDFILWRKRREDLIGFGGELDRAVPMPG